MTSRRLAVAAVVALATTAAILLGGVLRPSAPAGASGRSPAVAARQLQAGFAAGDTASLVSSLQASLRARPRAADYALLGLAYQQRARETADPAYYPKAERVLRDALRLDPRNLTAHGGLASLALSRHKFAEALSLGRATLRLSPSTARTYGAIGDAQIELGRYEAAFQSFDTMSRLRPSLASYARVSYARELLGAYGPAVEAMRLAVDAAQGDREPEAWTRVQFGKLLWTHGHGTAAAQQYRLALGTFPNYVYAQDALAQVEAGRGNYARAIALEQAAVDTIPLPQFVALLGDLQSAAGHPAAARKQFALIGAIDRLLAANGVRTDLESALFRVDHGIAPRASLALARRARAERPSIDGDDVLAWALARNGRCGEALVHSRHALRLGTQDALKFFHRGMIERCLGNRNESRRWMRRALALNPHFSVRWTPLARRVAR